MDIIFFVADAESLWWNAFRPYFRVEMLNFMAKAVAKVLPPVSQNWPILYGP